MKEEYSIGDWAALDDEYLQVKSIYWFNYYYRANNDCIRVEHLKPISLTCDMLIRNGFKNHFACWTFEDFMLFCSRDEFYVILNNKRIDIKSVNQLQHALRFYGLSDIADNFKV